MVGRETQPERVMPAPPPRSRSAVRPLTPEEEAINDPDDEEDDVDETLPADLWF